MTLMKLKPAILIALVIAPVATVHAVEEPAYCRLKGGSIVQLPASACAMEGGIPVTVIVPAAPAVVSEPPPPAVPAAPIETNAAANPEPADPQLAAAQKAALELLNRPVGNMTTMNRNAEGIERTAKFEGCRLKMEENVHIKYGNLFSRWKDFRISSSIDLNKLTRDEFGVMGKIESKGGRLIAFAVYFDGSIRMEGNGLSIAVDQIVDGQYLKYTTHTPSAYWYTPRNDLWIADEYGYPKEDALGNTATDRIRLLLIVSTSDEAAQLEYALEAIHTRCKSLPASHP